MRNLTMWKAAVFCLAVTCALLGTSTAVEAQLTAYPGKLICGYEQGNVPLLSNPFPFEPPLPYENFKPGNYATAFNLLNLTAVPQPVTFVLTLLNIQPVTIFTLVINPFSSIEVGCEEVYNPFLPSLLGQQLDGMLIPVAPTNSLSVTAVYTFESQNEGGERGGLGLGASIDVERIEPVTLVSNILDVTTDAFPIEGLANPDGTEEPADGGK